MNKESIKSSISFHRVKDKNLFIIPALPSWFVLSDEESIAFHLFLELNDKTEFLNKLSSELNTSRTEASTIYKNVLDVLKKRKVYQNNDPTILAPDAGEYPTNIHLAITHKCNLQCKHCYIGAGKEISNELDKETWIKGFNNLFSVIPKPDITISGGEPTLVKDLPEIISFLNKKTKRIVFYTNGTSNINSILPMIDEVQVSLEGLSSSTHDYIRGDGTFKKVSDFILDFPEKQKLKIALTLMHHNFNEIKNNITNWLSNNNLNLENIRFNAELEIDGRAVGLPEEFHNFLFKNAFEIFNFISNSTTKQSQESPSLILKNMRNCGIGISIGIDSNGDIYPCDAFINKQGSILDSDIKNIIHNNLSINEVSEIDNIEDCKECDLKYICLGGCKAKNYKTNNSYIKTSCNEKTKYIKYAQMVHDVSL